jgi:predicted RecB family nuclease
MAMLLTDDLLLDYKRCQRRAFLNMYGQIAERTIEREFLLKLQRENRKQIAEILVGQTYCEPNFGPGDWQAGAKQTLELMQQGVDLIYNGVLLIVATPDFPLQLLALSQLSRHNPITFLARPTLLIKQPGRSNLGDWYYVPVNVKLGKRPKPEYKVVAAFHAYVLAQIQGILPPTSRLIVRQQKEYDVDLNNWLPRMEVILAQCYQMLHAQSEPEVFISRQRCSLCQWHNACHAIAQSQQHLSLVPGVTPSRYQQLQESGITSLAALAEMNSPQIDEVLGREITLQLRQQAQSMLSNQPILRPGFDRLGTIPIADIELYFDIEAEPDRDLDYLLGVLLVDRQAGTEQFYPFLAETPEDEALIWQQFLALVSRHPEAPIFHFAPYEVETVRRLAQQYKTPLATLKPILSRLVDLHHWVTNSVTLPIESYSLKSLATWLGFQWRERGVNGEIAVCWYDRWLRQGDRAFLEAIVRYNEDDCRATYRLKDWLTDFLLEA